MSPEIRVAKIRTEAQDETWVPLEFVQLFSTYKMSENAFPDADDI